jgi:carboxypeptidase family protein
VYKQLVLVLTFLLLGCSGEESGGQAGPPSGGEAAAPSAGEAAEPAAGAGKPWDPSKGTASIKGTVKFLGGPPKARAIDMAGADAKCAELHGGERLKPEAVIVNDNGTLRNVFVWVTKGVEGWSFPLPDGQAVLNQKGCMYEPHVQGMRVGQTLAVKTSDPTAHNVHGYGKANRSFNRSQPPGAADVVMTMKRDEANPPMKVKCDIHPWMNAFIAVVPHPYYAVTGADGSFELAKLPPGTYTIQAWQEEYDTIEQTVTVGDNETSTLEFAYPKKS